MKGVLFSFDFIINYFNSMKKPHRRITYTHDVVRQHNPVYYFRKHSVLTWMFDQQLLACTESGLISYWASKYQCERKKNKGKEPKKLEIHNISIMLQISIVMYAFASVVFVLELMTPYHRHIKNFLDFLTY